ncbi:MAG: WD40 repeat domain-containing protein [Deltaproteobacteria bacterium]|nr:MAG: WD40 repeat domain-containing protein [Deltaproteobacteria bacterium]
MPQISRPWFSLALVLPFFLVLVGCDEGRFGVPKKSRLKPGDTNKYKRMLPGKLLPLAKTSRTQPSTRPTTRPSASTSLGLEFDHSHAAAVQGVAFDPSGTMALSLGADRTLILWNLTTQKKIRSWSTFKGSLRKVQFSPDGRRFLVLEAPGVLSLWSRQGQRLRTYTHKHAILDARFAPLDNRIVAVTEQGKLLFLQSFQLKLVSQEQACPAKTSALQLAIDAGQKWLAVSCSHAQLWMRPWDQATPYMKKLPYVARVLALSGQGTSIAMGTEQGVVALWKVKPKPLSIVQEQRVRGHLRAVTGLAFHPSLPKLASSSLDQAVGVWSLGSKLKLLRLLQNEAGVESLAYSPATGASHILTGESDGSITLWKDHGKRIMTQAPPTWKANTLSFSPKANWLATDAGRGGVMIWDLNKGVPHLAMKVHPFHLLRVSFAQDGNHFISADRRNIAFWDLRSRRSVTVLNPPKKSNITAVVLGRDWTQAFYGTDQRGVHLWTVAGPKRLFHDYRPQCVTSIAFHPLTRQGAVGTCEGMLFLYDFSRYQRAAMQPIAKSTITNLKFSADGKKLLVLTARQASLWAVPKLKKVAERTFPHVLLSGTFLGKGSTVALTGAEPGVRLWEPGSKKPLTVLTQGCKGPARGLHLPPKKNLLAVSCLNGTVALWDRKGKRKLATLVGLPSKEWLAYTPMFNFVASEGAPRYFFVRSGLKRLSLQAYQRRLHRHNTLQQTLQNVSSTPGPK